MLDSVKMVDTVGVYLKVSRAELMHGRVGFLQSGQEVGHQQSRILHYFRSPAAIATRKRPNTFQPSRSFNSSADYARLGLPPMASRAEIKSAYFSLAKKLHPDNGGDARQFNEVTCLSTTLTLFQVTEAYKRLMHDTQYVDGANGINRHKDPQWDEEMERKMRARMWMEQRMMEEEWARRRAQQKHWQNYQSGRVNHERAKLVRAFMMPLMIMMMGSMVFFQMLFFSITPTGCSQYEQGCSCNKCTEHERWESAKGSLFKVFDVDLMPLMMQKSDGCLSGL